MFDHGYHGRTLLTMTLTAKNMPYKQGFGPFAPEVYRVPLAYPFRWPTGPENCAEEAAAQAIDQITKQIGAENVAAVVIEPIAGRGRLHRARPRASCRGSPSSAGRTASSSSPTRCRPASPVPGDCSPARTRASCPTSSPPPRASRAACRWPPSPAARRSWTRCTPAAWAAPTAATRSPARRRWACWRPSRSEDLAGKARRIGEIMLPRLRALRGALRRRSATCAAAAR